MFLHQVIVLSVFDVLHCHYKRTDLYKIDWLFLTEAVWLATEMKFHCKKTYQSVDMQLLLNEKY